MKIFGLALLTVLQAPIFAEDVKRIPPAGIEVPAADRLEIETGLKNLSEQLKMLRALGVAPGMKERELKEIEIFHNPPTGRSATTKSSTKSRSPLPKIT